MDEEKKITLFEYTYSIGHELGKEEDGTDKYLYLLGSFQTMCNVVTAIGYWSEYVEWLDKKEGR